MPDSDFFFEPVPHKDAARLIAGKPAVSREVFDKLLPELRGRAFLVTGIESLRIVSEIRNRIAELPEGGDWEKIRDDIASKISPWMATSGDPDEQAKQEAAAQRRAELLLRMHGFQAYQASQHEVMQRQSDVMPFWQYLTMQDERVRPAHAALNKVVLPANHPFWQNHFPPWDFGCRCQVVPISQDDYDDIKAADAKKAPEQRDILEGPALKKLEENGTLFRAIGNAAAQPIDVRAPAEKAITPEERRAAYRWNPGDLRISLDELKARYADDPQTWGMFESYAKSHSLDEKGTTVWEWLNGSKPAEPTKIVAPPPPEPPKQKPVEQPAKVEEPKTTLLPAQWTKILANVFESGTGNQQVDITLKDGTMLRNVTVWNGIEANAIFNPTDITEIAPSQSSKGK